MQTNADITIFNYRNDGYRRKVINNVFFDSVKRSNVIKSGSVISDSVSLTIPISSCDGYLSPKDYAISGDIVDKFTLQANTKDFVVKGIVNYDIDNTSQQTISQSLKHIKDNYDMYTVSMVDPKLFGSPLMHHYEISCK